MDAMSPPPTSFMGRVGNVMQWTVFAFMALCVLVVAADLGKINAPGAPITYLYICIAVAVFTAFIHLPVVFRRLPRKVKWAAYLAILPVIAMFGDCSNAMNQAYAQTPEGAIEAAQEARKAASRAERDRADKAVADATAAKEKVEEDKRELEKCFSFLGHGIPKLTSQVKDSLENPHSFEYVRTDQVDDGTSSYNVELIFRAENGFGAIRTASVRAKINPQNCSVADVSAIEN